MKLITGNDIRAPRSGRFGGSAPSELLPVQERTLDDLVCRLQFSHEVALVGMPGSGRSTIVRRLAEQTGAALIDIEQFVLEDYSYRNRLQTGGEFIAERLLDEALERSSLVIVDDYSKIDLGSSGAFRKSIYEVFRAKLRTLGARLVTVRDFPKPGHFESPEDSWRLEKSRIRDEGQASLLLMDSFAAADYRAAITGMLGEDRIAGINFDVVYRYASALRLYEIQLACRLLSAEDAVDTDAFINCLEEHVLHGNLRAAEVEAVDLRALPGAEEIVEALETHVVLPFENRELAHRLGVKPKRGVLLYGPPGTGKTSIGRALAHRMKGKFFMIDGSISTEPPNVFFDQFMRIVTLAKENAPAVLFIDDADVLFEVHHVAGLVRYLLSLLDGMESASASNVCVMMTAMDARKVPDALMRSGRVELWLETRPPDAQTRARILGKWNRSGLPGEDSIDYARLGEMTEGFTPADLRRIAGDARLLYAADRKAGRPTSDATTYMVDAVRDILDVRARMALVVNGPRAMA